MPQTRALLRNNVNSIFKNLSRRSQGLVERQLRLIDALENSERDPGQLAQLFKLDHLATRMRRNNENLMVLSGSELGRRHQRPATLSDLLRASVSEIEQYQRVVLLPAPDVLVVGYAVGDLVRLVAELLDNATAFSAPDTQVVVSSSAAFRRTAARSSHGQRDHSRWAFAAASTACATWSFDARCQSASTWRWSWGITACALSPVRTSLPPMTSGMSRRSAAIDLRRAFSSAFSGEPGA